MEFFHIQCAGRFPEFPHHLDLITGDQLIEGESEFLGRFVGPASDLPVYCIYISEYMAALDVLRLREDLSADEI